MTPLEKYRLLVEGINAKRDAGTATEADEDRFADDGEWLWYKELSTADRELLQAEAAERRREMGVP